MTSAANVPIERRRAALEELRAAHRILRATRPVVHPLRMLAHQLAHLVGFFVAPLSWGGAGPASWDHDAAEIEVARDGVRRAMRDAGVRLPADLDALTWDRLVVLVEATFAEIRGGDPRLRDIEPLHRG